MEGRGAFSTADVRAIGVSSRGLCGCGIVYDAVALSAALTVAGDNSSSSCGAEWRRRMPPLGGSPAPDIVPDHLSHEKEETTTANAQPSCSYKLDRAGDLAACPVCNASKRLRGAHDTLKSRHGQFLRGGQEGSYSCDPAYF